MSEAASERRQWPRIPAAALSHIAVSIVAGPAVKLVNLSRGGALMQIASRFSMRARVRLKLSAPTGEVTVAEGVVAWARVAAIVDKQVNYLVAVAFDKPIPDLGGLDAAPIPESAPTPEPFEAPVIEAATFRGNVSQFPVPVARNQESAPETVTWNDADEQVVSLDGVAEANRADEAIAQAVARLHGLSAANDTILARPGGAEAVRHALWEELEAERRAREEELGQLLRDLAAAAATTEALQAAVAAKQQEYTRIVAAKLDLEAHQSRFTA